MCEFIEIEELAANALIEKNSNEISLQDLERYGNAVIEEMENRGKNAVLLMSRDYFSLFSKKSDFFSVDESVVRIKEGIGIPQLKESIRYNMNIESIRACRSERALSILQS